MDHKPVPIGNILYLKKGYLFMVSGIRKGDFLENDFRMKFNKIYHCANVQKDKKSSTANSIEKIWRIFSKNMYWIFWKLISLILKANRVHNFRMKLAKSATVQMYEDKKSSTTEQYRESAQAVCMCMYGAHNKVFQIFLFCLHNWKFFSHPGKIGSGKNTKSLFFLLGLRNVLSQITSRQIPVLSWAIR